MATALTTHELEAVDRKLREAAGKFAASAGMRKTSVDQIAAAAGVSKSIFYKLYETKEHLFLQMLEDWHDDLSERAMRIILERTDLTVKERLVQCVMEIIRFMDECSMVRFLDEDVKYIIRKLPEASQYHLNEHEIIIRPLIEAAGVRINVSMELVSAMVHTLIWTITHRDAVGELYMQSIEEITRATINQIVMNA